MIFPFTKTEFDKAIVICVKHDGRLCAAHMEYWLAQNSKDRCCERQPMSR